VLPIGLAIVGHTLELLDLFQRSRQRLDVGLELARAPRCPKSDGTRRLVVERFICTPTAQCGPTSRLAWLQTRRSRREGVAFQNVALPLTGPRILVPKGMPVSTSHSEGA
jgi:hypothetical protein